MNDTPATTAAPSGVGERILSGLKSALALVEAVGPVVETIGGAAGTTAVKVATAALELAEAVTVAVEDGKAVLDAGTLAQVQELAATLQAKNDALAAQVAAS